VRTEDSKYPEVEWNKLSQSSLIELKELAKMKKNTKLLEAVETYIEIPLDEKIKKTENFDSSDEDEYKVPKDPYGLKKLATTDEDSSPEDPSPKAAVNRKRT
jgi:hypothetical protein